MKKLMFGLVAVSSLVFGTGCGGNACEDIADALDGLEKKAKDCPSLSAALAGAKVTDAQKAECKEEYKKCSSSEKDSLNDAVDCIEDLPNCKSGEENAWAQKLQACAVKISTVNCD
jgi:hypothetical protein